MDIVLKDKLNKIYLPLVANVWKRQITGSFSVLLEK